MESTTQRCYSKVHAEATQMFQEESGRELVNMNNYSQIPKELFETLNEVCGSTTRKKNKFCKACIQFTRMSLERTESVDEDTKKRKASQSPEQSTSTKKIGTSNLSFQEILEAVSTTEFTNDQFVLIMEVLGKKLSPSLIKFVTDKNKEFEHHDMISQNTSSFLEATFQPLRAFFSGIRTGIPARARRNQDDFSLAKNDRFCASAIEMCFSIANQKYISTFALAEMLYIYFLSSSSRASDIHGSTTAGGSTKTLQSIIAKFADARVEFPDDGYVVVALDNNQKIGKTYHIELDSKVKCSVVTALTAFQVPDSTDAQQKPFKFGVWYHYLSTEKEDLVQRMIEFSKRSESRVAEYLHQFIKERILYVHGTLKSTTAGSVDDDLQAVTANDRTDVKMNKYVPPTVDYCKIFDQTCHPENPNSYETVRHVFDHIQKISLGSRKWITVVGDGLPYYIGQEIIRKFVKCSICADVISDDETNHHYASEHAQPSPAVQLERKYQNILLRPGAGHYEMNLLKSIFNMWFPLFIEPVAEKMGFKTAKAKMYCKKSADHHKSWEMLEIIFESMVDELIYSYLKKNLTRDSTFQPDVTGFLDAAFSSKNDSAKLAAQFAFHWVFPLLMFRSGIRQCNFQASIMAREVATDIFYIRKHPRYQKINALDVAELQNTPKELREAVYRDSMRLSASGSGQGVDFLLEQRNKVMKNFVICSGVPTTDQWIRASSSLQSLEKVVTQVQARLSLANPNKHRAHDQTAEVLASRELFRSGRYCDIYCFRNILEDLPQEARRCLKYSECKKKAVKNKQKYYGDLICKGSARITSYAVEEGTDGAELLTVADLKKGIREMTAYLPVEEKKKLTKGYSTLRKAKLIDMYRKIAEFISHVPNDDDNDGSLLCDELEENDE